MLGERLICDVSRKIHSSSMAAASIQPHWLGKWKLSQDMICKVEELPPFPQKMHTKHNTTSRELAGQCNNWCMEKQSLRKSKSWTNFAIYWMLNLQWADQSNLASDFGTAMAMLKPKLTPTWVFKNILNGFKTKIPPFLLSDHSSCLLHNWIISMQHTKSRACLQKETE